MKTKNIIILGVSFFFILFASGFFFVVDQTKQVIVLQFGEPRAVHQTPGLKFKLPFIQNVVYYDSRVLNLDPAQEEVILRDQKRIVVDSIVRYVINDPLTFFQMSLIEPIHLTKVMILYYMQNGFQKKENNSTSL